MESQLTDFTFQTMQGPESGIVDGTAGEFGGGEAEGQVVKNQTKTKPNKMNCSTCKKTTKKVPGNRDGGVKCGVCQFWWHPSCLNMDPDLLKWIVMGEKLGNDCCWTCQHCQEAHIKTEQAIKAMSSRMKTVEHKVDRCEAKQEQMEDKQELNVAKQDKVNTEFEDRLKKLELNSGSGVIREIDDRMDKSNNLVVHRMPESIAEDPTERTAHDTAIIKVLMEKYMGLTGMDTDNKVRFIRRMGKKGEREEARPILLGLKFTADLETILDRSWMLGQSSNKAAQEVNIVRDLTVRQRQREADLVTEACKKNLVRNIEEQDLNLVYKVVGRKGEKREIKVPLRQGERLDDEGRVIRGERWAWGNSRGGTGRTQVTGANSEPLGRERRESLPETRPKPAVLESGTSGKKKTSAEKVDQSKGREEVRDREEQLGNKASGDWEWQPATGKRGRSSPSPDKLLKKVRGVGVLELKNRFQKMAEDIFGGEEREVRA